MGLKELKKIMKEHEDAIKHWREEEKLKEDSWNIGYNDGFEDCYTAIKRALDI